MIRSAGECQRTRAPSADVSSSDCGPTAQIFAARVVLRATTHGKRWVLEIAESGLPAPVRRARARERGGLLKGAL